MSGTLLEAEPTEVSALVPLASLPSPPLRTQSVYTPSSLGAVALSFGIAASAPVFAAPAMAADPDWYRPSSATFLSEDARMPWPSVEAFVEELRAASLAQTREDGAAHPVDALVARLYGGPAAGRWLQQAFLCLYAQPAVLSDLIRGLAWLPRKPIDGLLLTPAWLIHPDASVRESATRLIEHSRDRSLREPLAQFAARERVPWLKDYMLGVVADLS